MGRYIDYGYRPGNGPWMIWLDNVRCNGTESDIGSCSHRGWGTHSCSHSQDVSISCTSNETVTYNWTAPRKSLCTIYVLHTVELEKNVFIYLPSRYAVGDVSTGRLPWQPAGIKFYSVRQWPKISMFDPAGKTMYVGLKKMTDTF